ncbi:hypothetical protein QQX13_12705 [Demequina sp. SYSU T00068]|uniref:hypothetical protein n=1 Tax=Demequina lignilytica TaxID=3051663 RepID=UPI002621A6C1|nr:hypothetical protein [Demequina sp. SYSU T00068]MDN4491695.1 hypothetical protein [Demequina sp. SYSU T00068]
MAPPMPEPGPVATRRQQWTGAIAIAVSMLLLAVVAPWAGDELSGQHIGAGDTLTVGGNVELTVAEGWSLGDGGGLFTVLENGESTMTVLPASSVTDLGTAEDTIQTDITALEGDTTNEWEISEVSETTTDAGDTALHVLAASSSSVQDIWVISDGESVVSVLLLSTPDDLDRVVASSTQMAMSVRITGEGL